MTAAEQLKPSYARNMRLIGHSDQAGRSDGQQIMVRNGYAYIGHVCSKGFSVIDVRDPAKPEAVAYVQNPPNTWSLHLQVHDDLLLLVHGRDMFSQAEMADERNYYKPQSGSHGAHVSDSTRDWSAGMAVFDISKPTAPRQIGFMAVEGAGLHRIWYVGGRWAYASAMIDGFSDYILVTIDMADPTKPEIVGRYWLPGMNLAAGEKADLAAGTRPLRPPPCGRRRRHRLLRLARRLPGERRRVRQGPSEAHRPSRLVAAVRRRNAQLPAPPGPKSAHRPRRGGARQHGGRLQADLGVRQPGQVEPDQHFDLPVAERPGLCRGRWPFRPAQHPREPARLIPELEADLRHLSERWRQGL